MPTGTARIDMAEATGGTARGALGGTGRRLHVAGRRVGRGSAAVARWLETDQYGDYRSVERARWSRGRH